MPAPAAEIFSIEKLKEIEISYNWLIDKTDKTDLYLVNECLSLTLNWYIVHCTLPAPFAEIHSIEKLEDIVMNWSW